MLTTTLTISESMSEKWIRINHEDREKYCTVYRGSDGGFMIMNVPQYRPAAEFFYKLIEKAELKKHDEKQRHIHITDIAFVMSQINFSGNEPFNFNITGISINDLPTEKIISVYKFPVDNCYMVMLSGEKYRGAVVFTSEISRKKPKLNPNDISKFNIMPSNNSNCDDKNVNEVIL